MKTFLKKGIKVDIAVIQDKESEAIILFFVDKKVIPFRIESPRDIEKTIRQIEECEEAEDNQ